MPGAIRLRRAILVTALLSMACSGGEDANPSADARSNTLLMKTSLGEVAIELFPEQAPITTANFLRYVNEGFYDGQDGKGATQFHRVIADFMVQGGLFTAAGSAKAVHEPIANEAAVSGLSNVRGTIAMARTSAPDSATSQFYINVVDNGYLDASSGEPGYAVFGAVTAGMEVVDQIAGVVTDGTDRPTVAIVIESLAVAE
jgi:peptidyl-prolyl cis-trans isomerase A (cyclophilin A)